MVFADRDGKVQRCGWFCAQHRQALETVPGRARETNLFLLLDRAQQITCRREEDGEEKEAKAENREEDSSRKRKLQTETQQKMNLKEDGNVTKPHLEAVVSVHTKAHSEQRPCLHRAPPRNNKEEASPEVRALKLTLQHLEDSPCHKRRTPTATT